MTLQKATRSPGASEKPQVDRFRETARKLDCDEDEAVFDEKLKWIAGQKQERSYPLKTRCHPMLLRRYAHRPRPFRGLKETLARDARLPLRGKLVWRRPVGVRDADWSPFANRSVYRNGWQERRHDEWFKEVGRFVRARRDARHNP